MPASESGVEDVLPEMNHRSSAVTARRKTRFVVRSGRIETKSREESGSSDVRGRESVNFIGIGANTAYVPVPVLCTVVNKRPHHLYMPAHLPVWSVFTLVYDLTNEVKILILLMEGLCPLRCMCS